MKEFVLEISFRFRVQTTGGQQRFTLTQLPLLDTVVDFWRLVAGNDVSMIVSLGCKTDEIEVSQLYRKKVRQERLAYSCKVRYFNLHLLSK